ncbi:hypothetical protein SEUCBS139899_008002 [Sporothrix eucalyptigena]|uniref:Fumarylacetoacetase-like C-terminal domain-containing protein n=1 Tax=Sporothrix eucalyptigena TaxID=1812306 RepID=A0ABP0C093_9PEZI
MDSFLYLVRFRDEHGDVYYGEAGEPADGQVHSQATLVGRMVPVFRGTDPWDAEFALSDNDRRKIHEVLCPLARTPIFACVGLNYKQHAAEANMSYGTYPTVFTKPPDALSGPYDDVSIHPSCLEMDYESELCLVLKKDIKNWGGGALSDVVLGYTAGNDVSSRWWQNPTRSNHQHAVAKSFDKFAPLGPVLASPRAVPDPTQLHMTCFVNGELRQQTKIDDQIYDIPTVLAHLSRGMTLRRGTVIMTGTPSGVAAFRNPPAWLQDGDQVVVRVDKVGEICNKMVFERRS